MKMTKQLLILMIALVTSILINGCAIFGTTNGNTPEPTLNKIEDFDGPEKVSPIMANKILDKTLNGVEKGSYKDFSYRFNVDLKKRITEKKFDQLRKGLSGTIGEYKNREYLGALKKGPLMIYLWKGEFSKAKNNDLVIRLTLGELDEAVQVFAFEISNR